MQLIVTLGEGGAVEIKCPLCDSLLKTTREQDKRVHIMQHPLVSCPIVSCPWGRTTFRVDRLSGYAEPWPEVKEEECEPSEDATLTSTSTSAKTPCTTSRSVVRHTPRDTPAGAPGRIRR